MHTHRDPQASASKLIDMTAEAAVQMLEELDRAVDSFGNDFSYEGWGDA
jgi:hypothetical protein